MKVMAVTIAALPLITTSWAQGGDTRDGRKSEPMQTVNNSRYVALALEKYAQGPITDLWKRPGLSHEFRGYFGFWLCAQRHGQRWRQGMAVPLSASIRA